MGEHKEKGQVVRSNFEEMARAIHASYLNRWNRHDPRAVERSRREQAQPVQERSSVA